MRYRAICKLCASYLVMSFPPPASRQGASCTLDELTASAFLTVELDRSLGGNAVQVGRGADWSPTGNANEMPGELD